jgi:hypothetical protein
MCIRKDLGRLKQVMNCNVAMYSLVSFILYMLLETAFNFKRLFSKRSTIPSMARVVLHLQHVIFHI